MQKLLVATLALCPLTLSAQAIRPAQSSSVSPVLLAVSARLAAPHAMAAAAGAAAAPALRVTTGVSSPELVKTAVVRLDNAHVWLAVPRTVVCTMTIDEHGVPQNVKVVEAANAALDQAVVQSVEQFRFKPSMLDGAPISRELTLKVNVPANVN